MIAREMPAEKYLTFSWLRAAFGQGDVYRSEKVVIVIV